MTIKLLKAIVVFTLIFLSLSCDSRMGITSISFNKSKWLESNIVEQSINVRPGMARDLINRKILISKSCEEIDDLLNIYEHIDCNKNTVDFELKQFYGAWIVGFDPISTEVLKIYFDNNQKVERAEIVFYEPGEKRE